MNLFNLYPKKLFPNPFVQTAFGRHYVFPKESLWLISSMLTLLTFPLQTVKNCISRGQWPLVMPWKRIVQPGVSRNSHVAIRPLPGSGCIAKRGDPRNESTCRACVYKGTDTWNLAQSRHPWKTRMMLLFAVLVLVVGLQAAPQVRHHLLKIPTHRLPSELCSSSYIWSLILFPTQQHYPKSSYHQPRSLYQPKCSYQPQEECTTVYVSTF